jgi:hypothetical protein
MQKLIQISLAGVVAIVCPVALLLAYLLDPVTALQDHCRDQASPHGHYRFPAALFLDGRTLGNQSGHAP